MCLTKISTVHNETQCGILIEHDAVKRKGLNNNRFLWAVWRDTPTEAVHDYEKLEDYTARGEGLFGYSISGITKLEYLE